jgi:hypothetical protein
MAMLRRAKCLNQVLAMQSRAIMSVFWSATSASRRAHNKTAGLKPGRIANTV